MRFVLYCPSLPLKQRYSNVNNNAQEKITDSHFWIFRVLKNTHKNPKFGRVRQLPIRELGLEFPGWDFVSLQKHDQDLGSDMSSMEFLYLFLGFHFTNMSLVVSRNVSCFILGLVQKIKL